MTHALDDKALGAHVLRALADRGVRCLSLADVAREVGARRADVRRVARRLDEEGFVDAARMRLTLAGLALATALRGCKFPDVRACAARSATAAA